MAPFVVVYLVTWPSSGSEAGVDFVLVQTSLVLRMPSNCVCI